MNPQSAAPESIGPALIALIIGAWLIVFPLMWLGITGLLSVVGGWRELASFYEAGPAPRQGRPAAGFVTGAMRRMLVPVRYSRCLAVELYADGFRLSVARPFRFMHPPLFIPWTAVRDCEERGAFWRYARITLHAPGVRIVVGGRAGREIRERWVSSRSAPAVPVAFH